MKYFNKTVDEKILYGCLDGIGTVSSSEKKTMLEYVRLGNFLFDSPTYVKMVVVANLLFFIHMHIIVIVVIAIS